MPAALVLISLAIAAQDVPPQTVAPAPDRTRAPAPDAAADANASDVIVTATRVPTRIDQVVSSVTVLDRADLDRAQDIGVTEQLLRTPGVSVSRNGGYGTNTSLRIRGAETDQTVVVIDGVKLNDPSQPGGGYNFGNLLVNDVSRIEVLRGPQSVLWGSQAIGGVVNIVTATPTQPLEASFEAEGGSRDTVSAKAAIGGKQGPVTFRLGAQTFYTDGISVISPDFGGRERDGYQNQTVTGRVEVAIADGVSVDLRGYYLNATVDLDSFNADSADYAKDTEFVGYAGLNAALFDGRLKNRVAYGYTSVKRDNYTPGIAQPLTFDGLGRNDRIEYQGSLAIIPGVDATFGVDHEHQRMRTVSPPGATAAASADLTGEYAQINATLFDGLTLSGGIRHDEHSRFGSKTLFQAGGVWKLPTGTLLRANYGEGFKAPTLYQLYSVYGNGNLRPEQASGWEAGAEQHLLGERLVLGATYFQRRSRDLIIFASCPFSGTLPAICYQPGTTIARFGYYNNVSRALAYGIEASGALKVSDRLQIDGNYTWSPSEDRSDGAATYGLQLARRPRQSANGSISYLVGHGVTLGGAVRYSGETFDNAAHTIRLAPYALVDLRGEVTLTKAVTFFGRIENLLDKDYETAYRYGTLGRSVYAGLRGRF